VVSIKHFGMIIMFLELAGVQRSKCDKVFLLFTTLVGLALDLD
jgi:hypothetical protein